MWVQLTHIYNETKSEQWVNPRNDEVQAYSIDNKIFRLTTEGVWVATKHYRDTDIFKEFLTSHTHKFKGKHKPIDPETKAEEMALLLLK